MKRIIPILIVLLLGSSASYAQETGLSEQLDRSFPAMSRAMAAGATRVCVPTHLTVVGQEANGKRFFASSTVSTFPSTVRTSSKGNKLTRKQTQTLDRVYKAAVSAQRTAVGFPDATITQAALESSLQIEAHMVCLTSEKVSATGTSVSR